MLKLFQRWPIETDTFFDCRNAARIRRYLRMYATDARVTTDDQTGRLFYRLAEVQHNGQMLAAVRHLDGGPGYEINLAAFRE